MSDAGVDKTRAHPLPRIAVGDAAAWADLFVRYRGRLRRWIAFELRRLGRTACDAEVDVIESDVWMGAWSERAGIPSDSAAAGRLKRLAYFCAGTYVRGDVRYGRHIRRAAATRQVAHARHGDAELEDARVESSRVTNRGLIDQIERGLTEREIAAERGISRSAAHKRIARLRAVIRGLRERGRLSTA